MTVPSTTQAIVYVDKGQASIQEVPVPKLRDDYVLIKVNAVGLNPTDWKHIDIGLASPGARSGCDYAGVVEAVGSKVTKAFQKGDRITGAVHGGDATQHENGAFANYIVAKGDVQIKIPDNVSDEEAATFGISVGTVAQGLYQTLNLALPKAEPNGKFVLIHGGSTATGIFGIQFARLSGYRVLATSSPHNFDYLKSLGAEAVFDYKKPAATVAAEIRAHMGQEPLTLGWDCVGSGAAIIAGALAKAQEGGGAKYATIIPVPRDDVAAINPDVDGPHPTLMYTIFGEAFAKLGNETPARPQDFEYAKMFWEDVARPLLASGEVKAPRIIKNEGGDGLKGVLGGLDKLREGKISAGKYVYTL